MTKADQKAPGFKPKFNALDSKKIRGTLNWVRKNIGIM